VDDGTECEAGDSKCDCFVHDSIPISCVCHYPAVEPAIGVTNLFADQLGKVFRRRIRATLHGRF
jgi:hypothetical protein